MYKKIKDLSLDELRPVLRFFIEISMPNEFNDCDEILRNFPDIGKIADNLKEILDEENEDCGNECLKSPEDSECAEKLKAYIAELLNNFSESIDAPTGWSTSSPLVQALNEFILDAHSKAPSSNESVFSLDDIVNMFKRLFRQLWKDYSESSSPSADDVDTSLKEEQESEAVSGEPDNTPEIFRYMSLSRFIQLITQGFYIASANNFEDSFDCRFPPKSPTLNSLNCLLSFFSRYGRNCFRCPRDLIVNIIGFYRRRHGGAKDSQLTDIKIDAINNTFMSNPLAALCELFGILEAESKKSTFISCWCATPDESYLLWKTYGKDGVRIKTTVKKFKDFIDKWAKKRKEEVTNDTKNTFEKGQVYDGALEVMQDGYVFYIPQKTFESDQASESKTSGKKRDRFFTKISAYEGEKEYRFVFGVRDPENAKDPKNAPNPGDEEKLRQRYPNGLVIDSLDTLFIDEVRISPFFTDVEFDALKTAFKKLGIDDKKIKHSTLQMTR